MWLHNLVVAEDISPLQPPAETDTNTHIRTSRDLVAVGLTVFGAAYLQSTRCVVFVRSSKSLSHGECPTEQINGLENLLRMLFTPTLTNCRWFSISLTRFGGPLALSSAQCLSVLVMESRGSNAFVPCVSPHPSYESSRPSCLLPHAQSHVVWVCLSRLATRALQTLIFTLRKHLHSIREQGSVS